MSATRRSSLSPRRRGSPMGHEPVLMDWTRRYQVSRWRKRWFGSSSYDWDGEFAGGRCEWLACIAGVVLVPERCTHGVSYNTLRRWRVNQCPRLYRLTGDYRCTSVNTVGIDGLVSRQVQSPSVRTLDILSDSKDCPNCQPYSVRRHNSTILQSNRGRLILLLCIVYSVKAPLLVQF